MITYHHSDVMVHIVDDATSASASTDRRARRTCIVFPPVAAASTADIDKSGHSSPRTFFPTFLHACHYLNVKISLMEWCPNFELGLG